MSMKLKQEIYDAISKIQDETYKVFAAIVILGIGLFIFLLYNDVKNLENIGGFVGGVIGTLIAGIVLFFVKKSYDTQQKTMKMQKKELKLQRQELIETRNQLKIQGFETVFFKMLDTINDMGKELKESGTSDKDFFIVFMNDMKWRFDRILDTKTYLEVSRHKDSVDLILKVSADYKGIFDNVPEITLPNPDPNRINNLLLVDIEYTKRFVTWLKELGYREENLLGHIYYETFKSTDYQLGHFFRYIYNTVKYVETSITDINRTVQFQKRKSYVNLIQSQLSNYQLIVFFYSCLSKVSYKSITKKAKFKGMLDEYGFFQNIPLLLFIRGNHQGFYNKTDFKDPYDKKKESELVFIKLF